MIHLNILKNDYLIFTIFASLLAFLGWISYLSALGGFFYSWIFSGFIVLMFVLLARQILIKKKLSLKISAEFSIILLAILVFSIISSYFATPTVFSGRDQGSLSEASIRLSQNHKLEFSTPESQEFFKIYGTGKALNFPGFYYNPQGQLITQFPIGYISWLAVFYSFFGISGLIIANAVSLFIFLVAFYLLARIFLKARFAVFALALATTSFLIFWFFKFTLSENLALMLLWISILQIILFIREKNVFHYFSFLIPAGLLVFTRIEGIFFLASGVITMFFLTKKDSFWKEKRKFIIIYPAIFLLVIFILNFTKDIYFYKEIAKSLLHFGGNGNGENSIVQNIFSELGFEVKIFYIYGILSFLILGISGIIYFAKNKKWEILAPFFAIVPSLIYLANPWISSDHPWMLRRYAFSIIPAAILYSVFFLAKWPEDRNKKYLSIISYVVIFLIIVSNLFIFSFYFTFSENKNLLEKTGEMSNNFKDTDLVLVDRLASGDAWSMISGPMSFIYGKKSVYIFNPEDIKKIDREKFPKIYLIAPNQSIDVYAKSLGKDKLKFVKEYFIDAERLIPSDSALVIPRKGKIKNWGGIYEIK
ncbi:MAG: hypothetical protein V1804_04125 [Patescibacteria group bacterium]